jgi:hypothetical protein
VTDGILREHGASPSADGILRRHGSYSSRAVRDISRREEAKRLMAYLTVKGCLRADFGWDYLTEEERTAFAEDLARVFRETEGEVRKLVMAELAAAERKAIALWCPRCKAQEGTRCWDMRAGYERRHVRHPHQERMDELAEAEAKGEA